MVAFLMRRCRLDATEVGAIRAAQRATLRKKDELIIRQAKDSDDKHADEELQSMTLVELERLLELCPPLEQQAVHSLRQQKENPEPTKGFTLGEHNEIFSWSQCLRRSGILVYLLGVHKRDDFHTDYLPRHVYFSQVYYA